jgi:SHS2 domain-containing protein
MSKKSRRLRVKGIDRAHLLVLLLKEVLYFFDTDRFLSRKLEIERQGDTILAGRLHGESRADLPIKTEIKAVTYHGLKIEKRRGRWIAEVVLDV